MTKLDLPTSDMNECIIGDTFDGLDVHVQINNADPPSAIASVKSQIRKQKKTGTILKEFTNGNGITITNAAQGRFTLNPFLIDVPAGVHFYDIQITFVDGTVRTYFGGTWTFTQDVTE